MAAVGETLDLVKVRAVEPGHLDGTPYAQLLPATVLSAPQPRDHVDDGLGDQQSRSAPERPVPTGEGLTWRAHQSSTTCARRWSSVSSRRFCVWNRLEGRPRTLEFDRALRAEVRDPLWMLTRQWQLGEFRGEDAGSPVSATFHLRTTRPTRYQAQETPRRDCPPGRPLEAVAEARAVPFTVGPDRVGLDLRVALGRRWMKLMAATAPGTPLPPPVQAKILARWPIPCS